MHVFERVPAKRSHRRRFSLVGEHMAHLRAPLKSTDDQRAVPERATNRPAA